MHLELISKQATSRAHATPLLFVHGAWHAAWCWTEHFMDYFATQGYSSYALSLRGHGSSDGRDRLRWTSIAAFVTDVASVAAQLPTSPVVVGHSMGGLVVQKYLETHPAPAAVLLASVPPAGTLATTLRIARRHPLELVKANVLMRMYPIVGTPQLTHEAFFSANMPEDKVRGYFGQIQDEAYRAFLDMMVLNLARPQRVKTPVLVLGAANDQIFHPHEVEATARAYHTQAVIFPDMAHDMMLEAGWQAVADRIVAWLNERGL